jgi:signal transduction histidine kinase
MSQALPSLDLLPVFNAQPGATLLLSPEWMIVGASDDYLAATSTQRDTIVGQFIFDAFPDNPQTPEANAVANVRASLRQVLATKQPHDMVPQHYDVPDQTRPGHFLERHWKPRHTPVLDPAGQVQFIIQSVQDITASRLAERQLRESQAREQAAMVEAERQRTELQRVFAQSPIAMGLLRGPDLLIEMANVRMGHIWGRPVAQLLGRPHFEALPDLAGQGFEQVLAGVLATGQPYEQLEQPITIAHPEQPYHGYLNITYLPEQDAHGQSTGILIYASDVTEQVRARQQVQLLNQELEARVQQRTEELAASNEQLHQSNTRLRLTNADLDNFVYTASHDLKAPISNIEGLLLLLPETVRADEQAASILTHMQQAVERFKRTISHLTDVSRLQVEFAQPALPLRLADVVEDVRQDLLPQLTATQAALEVAVDESWPRVFSAKNLRSVLYNLLSNALKYRHPTRPPRVRIACVHTDHHFVLTVQDNGLGLSEPQQTRLFQLFQRLHTHVEGTGVGLYMVKRIVEQAGGQITVQSQAGIGTTFTLLFPA